MRLAAVLPVVLGGILVAGRADAQSASPNVEIGIDVSAFDTPARAHGLQSGPRLVAHLDGRNALAFAAGLQPPSTDDGARQGSDLFTVSYRRVVHASGPFRVVATLGGGLERTVIVVPAMTFGNPPVTVPSSRGTFTQPVFTSGAGIDLRLASRAALVLESSFVASGRLAARFTVGLVVPVRPYPAWKPRERDRGRSATSAPWASLDAGERAWVTLDDGREFDGEVVGWSDSGLTLRTGSRVLSLAAAGIRGVDTSDPIRNGTVLGAKIGAAGALAPSLLVTYLVCALESECSAGDAVRINGLFVATGAGVGAAMGALVDSLRERRVPLYRRAGPAVAVTPIVGAARVGARAAIRW